MKILFNQFKKLNNESNVLFEKDLEKAKKDGVTIDGAEPYFKKHSDKGVLLIHGFAASPYELYPLAAELEKLDYSVYIVRVAGHGSNVDDFVSKTYKDWYESIELGYNTLASFCSKICVAGQSNGGLLATAVAGFNKVDALVLLAPAYKVKVFGFNLLPFIKNFIKYIPRKLDKDVKGLNYPVFPTKPLYEMMMLQKEVKMFSSNINIPVLLAVSNNDVLISPKYAKKIVKKMKSKDKTIFTYDNKTYNVKHILTEYHSIKIINDIVLWIKEKVK